MITPDLDLIKGVTETTERTPKNRAACGHLKRVVIRRMVFFFCHTYLAFLHGFKPSEGVQFFRDEAFGRRVRLRKLALKKKMPDLRDV